MAAAAPVGIGRMLTPNQPKMITDHQRDETEIVDIIKTFQKPFTKEELATIERNAEKRVKSITIDFGSRSVVVIKPEPIDATSLTSALRVPDTDEKIERLSPFHPLRPQTTSSYGSPRVDSPTPGYELSKKLFQSLLDWAKTCQEKSRITTPSDISGRSTPADKTRASTPYSDITNSEFFSTSEKIAFFRISRPFKNELHKAFRVAKQEGMDLTILIDQFIQFAKDEKVELSSLILKQLDIWNNEYLYSSCAVSR